MEKICNYLFSDLYFNHDGSDHPLIRGLARKEDRRSRPGGMLALAPAALMKDIGTLARQVISHNMKHNAREFIIEMDGVRYRCAMIAAPAGITSTKDEKTAWCLRRVAEEVPNLLEMGLPGWMNARLHENWADRGLTVISGPFGSGKTTLSASCFQSWVQHSREIGITLEDPIEVDFSKQDLKGGKIYQIDLVDRSMSEAIRFARRWAPRYIMIGEIRSPEAAVEMLSIAKSGPAVITTVHAADTVSAITQLIQFSSGRMSENDARESVSAVLTGVVHIDSRMAAAAARYLSVGDVGDNLVRLAIKDGRYDSINEDLDRQMLLRSR